MTLPRRLLILFLILGFHAAAPAAIDSVLRDVNQFTVPVDPQMDAMKVPTAQVVMADYALIARDFPHMRQHQAESTSAWHSRVDAWIIAETALISSEQTKQNYVNTKIPVNGETKTVYRPPKYGRAHVVPVQGGLMDAKGVGSLEPEQRHHGNGLATLGEMIREFLYEKAVQMIFDHSQNGARTVGSYAVVNYGFNVVHEDGSQSRAGYILRQAHNRATGDDSNISPDRAIEIEKVLRRYGVTSSGMVFGQIANGRNSTHDRVNLQGTSNSKTIEILDFGAFLTGVERFHRPILSYAYYNAQVIMTAEEVARHQPDPLVRLPLEMWGVSDKMDPKEDRPWRYSHDLAADVHADRAAYDRHVENFLGQLRLRIGKIRMTCGRVLAY